MDIARLKSIVLDPRPTVVQQPSHQKFDAYHHLTQLKQSGWTIRYLRYTGVKNTDLPSKIFLTYPKLSLRIVVSQWQI